MIQPIQYLRQSYAEIRKVTWPKRNVALQYTAIVSGISIIAMIVLGGLDIFFNYVLRTLIV